MATNKTNNTKKSNTKGITGGKDLGRGNTTHMVFVDDFTGRGLPKENSEAMANNMVQECLSKDDIRKLLVEYTTKTASMGPDIGGNVADDWIREATDHPENLLRTDVETKEWFSKDHGEYQSRLIFKDGTDAMSYLNVYVWEDWDKFAASGHKGYKELIKYARTQVIMNSANVNGTPVSDDFMNPPVDPPKSKKNGTKKAKHTEANPLLDNAMHAAQTAEKLVEDSEKLIEDEDNPLGGNTIERVNSFMKHAREMLQIMQDSWSASKKEFNLTDDHMKQLYQYNEEHKIPMPADLSEDARKEWDHYNGLDHITDDDVEKIFGKDHPIIGVHIDQTRDRIKDVVQDFFNWLSAMREYNDAEKAYRQLLEAQEDMEMNKLVVLMENEQDPEKKATMQAALDHYNNIKYMDFLRDPLDQATIDRLVQTWGDGKKIEYWINRTRAKLSSLKLNQEFILEISQFEKRFLPETYHELSNMTLLYFMNLIVYANVGDPKSKERSKIIAMIVAFDNVIRNIFDEELRNRVLNNIMEFLDQLIIPIYTKYYPDQPIPVKAKEVPLVASTSAGETPAEIEEHHAFQANQEEEAETTENQQEGGEQS